LAYRELNGLPNTHPPHRRLCQASPAVKFSLGLSGMLPRLPNGACPQPWNGRQLAARLPGGKAELQGWRRSGPALNA
jgi:hypothetical protein